MTSPAAVPSSARGPLVPPPTSDPPIAFRGWIMTAVITALAVPSSQPRLAHRRRDADLRRSTTRRRWQMLQPRRGDNPGFGWWSHPPMGKQLIAIGEVDLRLQRAGLAVPGAVFGVILVALVLADRAPHHRSTLVGGSPACC